VFFLIFRVLAIFDNFNDAVTSTEAQAPPYCFREASVIWRLLPRTHSFAHSENKCCV